MPDLESIAQDLAQMLLAFALAVPIGWDRETRSFGAGLRTFPLVAVASCGFVLIGNGVITGDDAQARILAGLMTGVGFIGGGAILKSGGSVSGTATAASIWITGAIGASVGWNLYGIAILLSVLNFLTLRWGHPLKRAVDSNVEKSIEE